MFSVSGYQKKPRLIELAAQLADMHWPAYVLALNGRQAINNR